MPRTGRYLPLWMPHELFRRLQGYARESGETLTAVVLRALEQHLDKHRPKTLEEAVAEVRKRYGYENTGEPMSR